jgi:hypothetical protein
MGKWLSTLGIAAALAVFSASLVIAAPQDKKKPAAAKMPSCPACKMVLVAKKDKTHMTAVKIKGKTYYCCDKCPMNKPAGKKAK